MFLLEVFLCFSALLNEVTSLILQVSQLSSDLNNVDRNLYFLQMCRNAGRFLSADTLTQLSLHKRKKCGVFNMNNAMSLPLISYSLY